MFALTTGFGFAAAAIAIVGGIASVTLTLTLDVMVNPPASGKYQYWTNDNIKDIKLADWIKGATEHKGSWWPDWREWLGSIGVSRQTVISTCSGCRQSCSRRTRRAKCAT